MRITFIMGKFNLRSSTSSDFFLKCKILKELGYDISIVTTFSHQNIIPENFPYKLYEEQISSTRLLALQKFAVKILKKYSEKTDIFYLASDIFAFGGGWYRKFVGNSKPVVMYFNGYMDFVESYFKKFPLWPKKYLTTEKKFKHKIRIFLELTIGVWLINQMDKLFTYSETATNYYVRAGIKENKIVTMSDFYDLDFLTIKSNFQSPFEKRPDEKHLLFTGRVYIDKGPDILIEAFSKLDIIEKCMLHMIGDGEMKNELKAKTFKLGLKNKIIFYGWLDQREIIPFLQHTDLYIQPTRLPGPVNRATVEAMANGIPLVVASTSGEKWISDVAKIYTNGDINSLKNTIEEALKNETELSKISKNGRERAKDFDYRKLGKKLDQEFQSIIHK